MKTQADHFDPDFDAELTVPKTCFLLLSVSEVCFYLPLTFYSYVPSMDGLAKKKEKKQLVISNLWKLIIMFILIALVYTHSYFFHLWPDGYVVHLCNLWGQVKQQ